MSKKILSNEEILQTLIAESGAASPSEYARILSKKYGVEISRQQIKQFAVHNKLNLTHLLLREAMAR